MSLLGKWVARLNDLFDDLIKISPMKPLPVMSRRQTLAAAADAARRIKRGGFRWFWAHLRDSPTSSAPTGGARIVTHHPLKSWLGCVKSTQDGCGRWSACINHHGAGHP